MYLSCLNTGLIWNDDNLDYDDIYLTCTKMDTDDDKKQAEIDDKYLEKGVITINQVRNRLQMPPVPWGNMPFVPLNYAPYDTLIEYQKSKIEGNLKRASSDKIDNNLKVPEKDKEGKPVGKSDMSAYEELLTGVNGIYQALESNGESDGNLYPYYSPDLAKNFRIPTGVEKMDPTEVKAVVAKIISEREKLIHKAYSFSSGKMSSRADVVDAMDLSWKNILGNG